MTALATERFGTPHDPALVLVMGATASRGWWPDALCHGLAAQGLHVIRYDNRDTGQSPTCPPGAPDYTVEDMADDILAVLDAENLASAHIMGMSLGGYLAQMAAVKVPERILSLTLYASEPLGWTGPELPGIAPGFMDLFAGFADIDCADVESVVAFQLPLLRFSAGSAHPFDAKASEAMLRAEYARAINPASAFNHGALLSSQDWSDAARRITQPTLVIHGTEDPILPIEKGRALAATIPGAGLIEIPGLGHEIPSALIPRLVDEVARFLVGP